MFLRSIGAAFCSYSLRTKISLLLAVTFKQNKDLILDLDLGLHVSSTARTSLLSKSRTSLTRPTTIATTTVTCNMSDTTPKDMSKKSRLKYEDDEKASSKSRTTMPPEQTDENDKLKNEGENSENEEAEKNSSTASKASETATEAEQVPSSKAKTSEDQSQSLRYATRGGFLKEHQKTVEEHKDKFFSMPIKEKRKLYKCRNRYVLLENVKTWPNLYLEELFDDEDIGRWLKRNKKMVKHDVNGSLNKKISLFRGDITALEIDAITNAANESLLGGGGVDGAIHAAAGPDLRSECELLNGCYPGDAKITCGYKLPAKYIIHTVGPRGEKSNVLESCYKKSLDLLKENQLKSVAFPCISTGIFGYPNENAAIVALRTVRNWLETEDYAENIERIVFCLFLEKDVDVYHRQAHIFFPFDE